MRFFQAFGLPQLHTAHAVEAFPRSEGHNTVRCRMFCSRGLPPREGANTTALVLTVLQVSTSELTSPNGLQGQERMISIDTAIWIIRSSFSKWHFVFLTISRKEHHFKSSYCLCYRRQGPPCNKQSSCAFVALERVYAG